MNKEAMLEAIITTVQRYRALHPVAGRSWPANQYIIGYIVTVDGHKYPVEDWGDYGVVATALVTSNGNPRMIVSAAPLGSRFESFDA